MRSTFTRLRAPSQSHQLSSHPPPSSSTHYSLPLAALAARVLYKSPLPSRADLPVYVLDAAAFPDAKSVNYDALLPYVLARLPGEEELTGGEGYEVVFFAGGAGAPEGENNRGRKGSLLASDGVEGSDAAVRRSRKSRPGWAWFLQAYNVLSRAMRKRLMRLYVVHEKGWIRVVMEMFATIVSPKVRKKVVHVSTLTGLALHMPIEDLLIPPSAYFTDRRKSPDIFAPYVSGKRAFGVKRPLPVSIDGSLRLPRVLREATSFLLTDLLIRTEGILRVSARAQTVEVLKEAYDRGQKFIVWKERDVMLTFPHYKEGAGTVTIDELDEIEGYDVHSAAAIIKLWYHELCEPIFPPSSYQALEKFYGGPTPPAPEQLQQLLSPGVEFSPLPKNSSRILIHHLLPLLSRVADYSDFNRMTPQNLAVVFAPNLVCGPDPMEDLKMTAIVQRLLVPMITNWKLHLAPALGRTDEMFEDSLRLPQAAADREDPLEEMRNENEMNSSKSLAMDGNPQVNGIALLDNDCDIEDSSSDEDIEEDEGQRPPLPPRPSRTQTSGSTGQLFATTSPVRRKPAPSRPESPQRSPNATITAATPTEQSPVEVSVRRKPAPAVVALPRYSTIITNRPAVLAALEQYNYNAGFEPAPEGDLPDLPETYHAEDLPTYEQSTPLHDGPQPSMSGPSTGDAEQRRPLIPPEKIHRKPVGEGEGKGGG